jgi:hypothetical protein
MTANGLQKRGLIHYSHGLITILDRAGLEQTACECYRARRREIDHAFGGDDPRGAPGRGGDEHALPDP